MSKLKTFLKLFLIFFLFTHVLSFGQNIQTADNSLSQIFLNFKNLKNSSVDSVIIYLSTTLDSELISFFSQKKSFSADLSLLKKYCSVLKSDDNLFQIITWNIYLSSGEYKYFGYIQYSPAKSDDFFFYNLIDESENISNPEYAKLNYKKWFGCLYYQLVSEKIGKKTIYTLLAWDGNDFLSNKKIVEVIEFQNNKPNFGYDFVLGDQKFQRLIFEYNKNAQMVLRWDEKNKLIVWDHLAPKESKYTGVYQFYGPDFTYDGLKFKNKTWTFVENIVVTNEENK